MENKINLEELMLRQLDLSLEMKTKLESKAVGYLTVNTLILGILLDFIKETYCAKICGLFKDTCLGFYIVFFIVGLLVLFLCAVMLCPRQIGYFRLDDLKIIRKKKLEGNGDFDGAILELNDEFIEINNNTIGILDRMNKIASWGLISLVIGFVICCVLFFIFIGAMK